MNAANHSTVAVSQQPPAWRVAWIHLLEKDKGMKCQVAFCLHCLAWIIHDHFGCQAMACGGDRAKEQGSEDSLIRQGDKIQPAAPPHATALIASRE
jgi:hypothetical protein